MPAPKVYIRCDSSNLIGSGHVIRNLALAEILRAHGHQIEFWCKDLEGALLEQIRAEGHSLSLIPEGLNEAEDADVCKKLVTDLNAWVVVDHYGLGSDWERHFYAKNFLIVIDDLASRPHFCNVIIDTNYYANPKSRYEKLLLPATKQFLGPQYSLLRKEFRDLEIDKPARRNGLLVFFGGHDSKKQTARFIASAKDSISSEMDVEVLVSKNNIDLPRLLAQKLPANIKLAVQPPRLSELFLKAKFYFGSGGTITWERMRCGLAGAVTAVADNQVPSSTELAANGFQYYLGNVESLDYSKVLTQLSEYMRDESSLKKMQALGKSLVKPLSYPHLADANLEMRLRFVDSSDARFLYDLRTDPVVDGASQSKSTFTFDEHVRWMDNVMKKNEVSFYIVLFRSESAGQVRIDADGTVSISLAANARGHGLSEPALSAALVLTAKLKGIKKFRAVIHKDNIASQKSFARGGFNLSDDQTGCADGFMVYQYTI